MTNGSYIICTNPRSGSTLLCGLLAQTGVAGNPDSFFRGPSRQWWADHLQVPEAVDLTDPAFCAAFLSAALAEGKGGGDFFGCRLMHESLPDLMAMTACLHPDAKDDCARIKAVFGQTVFVHLIREDKVDQAISYVRAEQTGTWHVGPNGEAVEQKGPPQPPRYDFARIHQKVVEFEAQDAAWARWFEQTDVHPLKVRYSDLADNPKHELRRILAHLNQPAEAAERAIPGVRKLADELNERWAAQYRGDREKYATHSLS
ncbi:Stf0 family sulfotransferase [Falsiruegeria mediterranea]|uniref:Trehalose 2-sulfotransferase n=1 Tax=Falsiruegeria mediterranea M17 TaxID=1200281 RepID=A0A2R8C9X0_9RHOB|nr:Stf0 family sulfotransferase [Falsiruegeria mediterranea]SPJ29241.1 Trehalose 2-sulfotransferase [Falsiruegeria mediterranea M17]